MPASTELQAFLREHSVAWQFAWKASQDYLLARLAIPQGFWSGFEVSTQAVEKLLKSYALFKDASLGGSQERLLKAVSAKSKVRGRKQELGHDVEAALDLATAAGLPSGDDLQTRLARINSYYALRYPGGVGPTSLSGLEIQDIDEAIFELWDAFLPINSDYFHTCGIMWPVYAHLLDERAGRPQTVWPYFRTMTALNQSYETRRESIEHGIMERLDRWYPGL